MKTQLTDCTATELLRLFRSGQASPVEATQAVSCVFIRLSLIFLAIVSPHFDVTRSCYAT